MSGEPRDRDLARQGRVVAVVIMATAVLWVALSAFGPSLGISFRYARLIDLVALAAFLWAFIVTFRIWRARDRD